MLGIYDGFSPTQFISIVGLPQNIKIYRGIKKLHEWFLSGINLTWFGGLIKA